MTGRIIGTGSYVPNTVWDNNKIAELVDTNDAWIRERTGIISRHISLDMQTSDMAIAAAKDALNSVQKKDVSFNAERIDAIFVCSATSDFIVPSIACQVQKELGTTRAFCYDLNAACSGFVFAYNMAVSYMNSGLIENALIIGSEQLSSIIDWTDRGSCILFGDGAGAVIVQKDASKGGMVMHSEGKSGEALYCKTDGKLTMDGQQVFRFAIKRVPEVIEELMMQMQLTAEDVDLYLLHQANVRIIDSVVKKLGIPEDKVPMNIERMGNTSSASIPILLDELWKSDRIASGSKIIIAGFGAGLSWGAGYMTVS